MEILEPHFTYILLSIALVLSALSLIILVVITVERWLADGHQQRQAAFEKRVVPVIRRYLEGLITERAALEIMHEDRDEALSLLIHFAHALEPDKRHLLEPLFAGLIVIEEEMNALHHKNVKRRLLAVERLGFLPGDASTSALLEELDDEVPVIRLCAARALALQGRIEALNPILRALDLPSELDNRREVEAITDYGDSAVPTLLSILEHPKKRSSNVIIVVVRVLGMLKAKEAVQPLVKLLKHPMDAVRLCAARSLGEIGDPSATLAVAALADDPAWRVRKKAVKAIGKLQGGDQIPRLNQALSDSSWWVRFVAAQALHSLGQPGIVELEKVQKSSSDKNAREICTEVLEEHRLLDTMKD